MNTPESRANIDSIKETVRALITKGNPDNRYWNEGFLSIFPEIRTFVNKDDKFQVFDGYHRTIALHELMAEGFDIQFVHIDARQMEDAEVVLSMVRSSLGLKHTPLEKAIAYKRLADDYGMSFTEISTQSGEVTPQRVEQLLLLGRADKAVHDLVAQKKITADGAIEILRKHRNEPEEALKAIISVVENKNGSAPAGRLHTRRTISKVSQDKMYEAVGSSADKLNQKIKAMQEKDGEEWETKPVSLELPAVVVAEILERLKASK